MSSRVIGWIEVEGTVSESFDWKGHPVLSSLYRHRLACLNSRLNLLTEACLTECLEADFEQLHADLEAEFEQLQRLAG